MTGSAASARPRAPGQGRAVGTADRPRGDGRAGRAAPRRRAWRGSDRTAQQENPQHAGDRREQRGTVTAAAAGPVAGPGASRVGRGLRVQTGSLVASTSTRSARTRRCCRTRPHPGTDCCSWSITDRATVVRPRRRDGTGRPSFVGRAVCPCAISTCRGSTRRPNAGRGTHGRPYAPRSRGRVGHGPHSRDALPGTSPRAERPDPSPSSPRRRATSGLVAGEGNEGQRHHHVPFRLARPDVDGRSAMVGLTFDLGTGDGALLATRQRSCRRTCPP